MPIAKHTEPLWYFPGRYYGCVEVETGLEDAAWHAAIDAHPVTQTLHARATRAPRPCTFCGARSTQVGTFLDGLVLHRGKAVVCVYTCCERCHTAADLTARIEDQYHQGLWWVAPQYAYEGAPEDDVQDAPVEGGASVPLPAGTAS